MSTGGHMALLPETKLLLGEYGNAAYDLGEIGESDPRKSEIALRMIRAKEMFVDHLETHYIPAPKA